MREFSNGQKVFIHNFGVGSRWISGVTVNSHGPLTWSIKLEDGKMVILQQIIFEIDMSRTMMKLFKNLKKLKLTTIFNYLTLLSCPIKAILHKKTEPTEPTQNIDNSNSPSDQVSETPLRQSSRIRNRLYKTMCDQKVG